MLIIAMLVIYFRQNQNETVSTTERTTVNSDIKLSAYEQFCLNNKDVDCGKAESFITKEETSKIILMDTDEIDSSLREQISLVVEQGYDIHFKPEDMNTLLDRLYEEELPDDIIDTPIVVKNDRMKDLKIIPAHRPPYFGKKPVIAVVIDDMGISAKRTADIASLKGNLTASFLTYSRHLEEQINNSVSQGQEIMIHVPMEALKATDIAPDVLTTDMTMDEIKANLRKMFQKFQGIKGVNNHMGSKLTEDKSRMVAIMQVLKEEGMFFLDSKTSPKSKAEDAARESGIAYAHRHIFLDNNNDKAYILRQLQKTEKLAYKNGYAIAIGHPKTQTYAALKEWLPSVKEKGIEIVPLSRIINVLNPQYASETTEK